MRGTELAYGARRPPAGLPALSPLLVTPLPPTRISTAFPGQDRHAYLDNVSSTAYSDYVLRVSA
eukprot:1722963-Rhodomonas_salina.1